MSSKLHEATQSEHPAEWLWNTVCYVALLFANWLAHTTTEDWIKIFTLIAVVFHAADRVYSFYQKTKRKKDK